MCKYTLNCDVYINIRQENYKQRIISDEIFIVYFCKKKIRERTVINCNFKYLKIRTRFPASQLARPRTSAKKRIPKYE